MMLMACSAVGEAGYVVPAKEWEVRPTVSQKDSSAPLQRALLDEEYGTLSRLVGYYLRR
jgi:hypothetical protein